MVLHCDNSNTITLGDFSQKKKKKSLERESDIETIRG
jgi:hypothetical protein